MERYISSIHRSKWQYCVNPAQSRIVDELDYSQASSSASKEELEDLVRALIDILDNYKTYTKDL